MYYIQKHIIMKFKSHTYGKRITKSRNIICTEKAYFDNDTDRLVQFGYTTDKKSLDNLSDIYKNDVICIFKIKKLN